MKNFILSLVLITVATATTAGTSYANSNCQPIYGGGQTCVTSANILINKNVQNPSNGQFVDNLGVNDTRFAPDQNVAFQLVVKNTSSASIDRVIVKDIFPQYVNFAAGPGNFDTNSKTLSFELTNLTAGESRTFSVTGKTSADKDLLMGSGVICVVNQATAQIVSNSQMSQDNAQFCIQKGVPLKTKGGLPVLPAPAMATTPATGPEMAVLPLLSGSGILGWLLRKRASK